MALGNTTLYMHGYLHHSPHRMLILASPRKGVVWMWNFDRLHWPHASQPILFQIAVTQTRTYLNPLSISAFQPAFPYLTNVGSLRLSRQHTYWKCFMLFADTQSIYISPFVNLPSSNDFIFQTAGTRYRIIVLTEVQCVHAWMVASWTLYSALPLLTLPVPRRAGSV